MMQRETGSLDDMSLESVVADRASSQSRLTTVGGATYVAIVNGLSDDMERAVDEYEPRLAPPDDLFYQWLNMRENLRSEGMAKTTAHNVAYDRVDYDRRFETYLDRDDDATTAIDEIASRVDNGENIVLVCYCNGNAVCHRTAVRQHIEDRL